MAEPVRSFSYGGGQQSNAALVLAAQGVIDYPLFLFANVGDDSEHPATLQYVRQVAMPYAARHGIELVELHRIPAKGRSKGVVETLHGRLVHPDSRSLAIPYRTTRGGPPMSRSCTADFKVRVVAKELQRRGATTEQPAHVGLGISVDEIERARPGIDPRNPSQLRTYPLLDLGLSRTDCQRIITDAGLPLPGKSSCWFCPFHDMEAWQALRRDTPDLFDRACELEAHMAEKRGAPVFLTRRGVPLAEAVGGQGTLELGLDGCDSGYCHT